MMSRFDIMGLENIEIVLGQPIDTNLSFVNSHCKYY